MARQKEKLKLGEGAAFDPTRLKELPQENETWEADFEALPKPYTQNQRHFLGMVVTKKGGSILAEMQVSRPSINDMATMLANAMLSPLSGVAHRPSRIYARYYTPWDDVYPHLKEIGIKVSTHREFPWIYHLFHERLLLQLHFALVMEVRFSCNESSRLHRFLCWPAQEVLSSIRRTPP